MDPMGSAKVCNYKVKEFQMVDNPFHSLSLQPPIFHLLLRKLRQCQMIFFKKERTVDCCSDFPVPTTWADPTLDGSGIRRSPVDRYQLLPSDLLITQMEVTFSPLKGSRIKHPKRSRTEEPGS